MAQRTIDIPDVDSEAEIAAQRKRDSLAEADDGHSDDRQVLLQPPQSSEHYSDGRYRRRLSPSTASLLRGLAPRFGSTLDVIQVDCFLRELVYEMPFSAEGISNVSQRMFTMFSAPQHALAQLGLGRHPGADKPGTIRTADFVVGLAVLITEGDLEDRIRNGFDIHDTEGSGHVDREFLRSFLQILSKHVVAPGVIKEIVENMFLHGDRNSDGWVTFDGFWRYAERNAEVLNWMDLYAHHLGAMMGQGQLGYLYIQQLRLGPTLPGVL